MISGGGSRQHGTGRLNGFWKPAANPLEQRPWPAASPVRFPAMAPMKSFAILDAGALEGRDR
ncbi:hypothetical protein P7K49_011888, partial [Saguinus oedipus]